MKPLALIPLLLFIIACGQSKDPDQSSTQDSTAQETKNDAPADTSITEEPVDIVAHWNDTCEKNYYGVRYIEDFAKFRTHEEVERYFGKSIVTFAEEDWGPAFDVPVSHVYDGYEDQIVIYWRYVNDSTNEIESISRNYISRDDRVLKPGGAPYTYKYGLHSGMPLSEFLELNGQPIVFLGMAFSLSHQGSLGLVQQGYLRKEFQNYRFWVGFIDEETTDKFAPDYLYLHNYQEIDPGYSTDDPNIDISKLCIRSMEYYRY
ncbi:MAG: hypothetical protein C0592_11230 [Marinilabiliales bacterium]|nr:MAG: hypothetical protein C0592_11230 [Marinilabiliales bacterium]